MFVVVVTVKRQKLTMFPINKVFLILDEIVSTLSEMTMMMLMMMCRKTDDKSNCEVGKIFYCNILTQQTTLLIVRLFLKKRGIHIAFDFIKKHNLHTLLLIYLLAEGI